MLGRTNLARNMISTMTGRYAHHGGDPNRALPIGLKNKTKFTIVFFAFFSVGLGAPWLIVRHQMLKGA